MTYHMTFTLSQERFNEFNDRRFKEGDLVFFLNNRTPYKFPDWGIVKDVFHDGYVLSVYELVDKRLICGVPIKDYNFDSPYMKTPKDFSTNYNKYFGMIHNYRPWTDEEDEWLESFEVTMTAEKVKEGIRIGILQIPSKQLTHYKPEWVWDKNGVKVMLKNSSLFDNWDKGDSINRRASDYVHIPFHEAYANMDEANSVRQTFFDEAERIQNMTDDEYEEYELDNVLKNCTYPKEEKARIKSILRSPQYKDNYDYRCLGGRLQISRADMGRWADFNTNEYGKIVK